ncbi:MAG: uroporphyrinogen decarboxylase family protein [Terracidiphilus sp.]
MNSRERVLAMMDHRPVDRIPNMPITMMFAADQIGVKYGQYVSDYRILVEAQLRTAERFDIDQVSCISDPTREAHDLGAPIRFFDDQPPAFDETEALLVDKAALVHLRIPDPLGGGRMTDRVNAAALLKERVAGDRIVEGWIEGPCGQAANLRGINRLMLDFTDDPDFVNDLLDFIVEMELVFARAQKDAGVELMGVGDPASSLVGPTIFMRTIFPAHKKLVEGMKAMGLRTRSHMCGQSRRILKGRGELGYDIVDLDSMVPLADARVQMPNQVILGNVATVDVMRNGSVEKVLETVAKCNQDAGSLYIIGAGCEVPRDTTATNMLALRDYARSHQPGHA